MDAQQKALLERRIEGLSDAIERRVMVTMSRELVFYGLSRLVTLDPDNTDKWLRMVNDLEKT